LKEFFLTVGRDSVEPKLDFLEKSRSTSAGHQLPLGLQPAPLNPSLQSRLVQLFAGHGQHGAQVAQVLFGAAFAMVSPSNWTRR
jgi:hypothetical protein